MTLFVAILTFIFHGVESLVGVLFLRERKNASFAHYIAHGVSVIGLFLKRCIGFFCGHSMRDTFSAAAAFRLMKKSSRLFTEEERWLLGVLRFPVVRNESHVVIIQELLYIVRHIVSSVSPSGKSTFDVTLFFCF